MNRIACAFALVPLIGISIFYFFHTRLEQADMHSVTVKASVKLPSSHSVTKASSQQRAEEPRPRKQAEDKLNLVMTRNAKAMTPQLITLLVDGIMRSREPKYRSLFENWHLDFATSDEVVTFRTTVHYVVEGTYQK